MNEDYNNDDYEKSGKLRSKNDKIDRKYHKEEDEENMFIKPKKEEENMQNYYNDENNYQNTEYYTCQRINSINEQPSKPNEGINFNFNYNFTNFEKKRNSQIDAVNKTEPRKGNTGITLGQLNQLNQLSKIKFQPETMNKEKGKDDDKEEFTCCFFSKKKAKK